MLPRGGHATNPGFPSTVGVLVAMSRLSDIVHDSAARTVVIGAGPICDDVYAAIGPRRVNKCRWWTNIWHRCGWAHTQGRCFRSACKIGRCLDMIDRLLMTHKAVWSDDRHCKRLSWLCLMGQLLLSDQFFALKVRTFLSVL